MSIEQEEPAACEICFTRPQLAPLRHCPRCTAHICASCFAAWLHVRIQYATANNLTCLSCPEPIPDPELRAAVGERAFRRCLYLRSRYAHRDDPAAAWCPVDGCWALLPRVPTHHPPDRVAAPLVCADCATDVCAHCKQVAHAGRCAAPVARPAHRVASALWRRLHTKKCPKCGVRIQRAGGCTQMHCTSCHTKFCWRCRGLLQLPYDLPPQPPGLDFDAAPPGATVVPVAPAASAVATSGPLPRRSSHGSALATGSGARRAAAEAEAEAEADVDVDVEGVVDATQSHARQRRKSSPAQQRHLYGCVCPRVHAVLSHIGIVGGVVIATPVVLAAAVVAAPPAVVTYACLSKQKKERLRNDISGLTHRL